MSSEERVALITGASGAVGREAIRSFAADGWRLGLVSRDRSRLADAAAAAGIDERRWVPAVADVRNADQTIAAVRLVEERFGRIDAVLHLVGGFVAGGPILDLDPDKLQFMLEQHLWSTLHVARAALPGMAERRWGRVVAITSSTTTSVPANAGVYATAKIAQETVLRILAKEVAGTGVTVNLVAVRQIDVDRAREREPNARNAAWTTPDEIVRTFRFLVSDAAGAINGARIPLDGR